MNWIQDMAALRAYAARIGADPTLVQGAGGNVSIKDDGTLWIKASGTWLAHAVSRDIMVPVSLATLDLDAEDTAPFVIAALNPGGLRPSIETTMHAVLPHRVVVHVHCVETIAWAVRGDAEAALADRLAGLSWCFVPYVRPGAPLTRAIASRLRPGMDVAVLGNHGLVVGAPTVSAASGLIKDIQYRLALPSRPLPVTAPAPASCPPGYVLAEDPGTHAVACDTLSLAVARQGSFYPDHVIFLGPGISETPGALPMVVLPGIGVFLCEGASPGTAALARCLADVTSRLDPGMALATLSAADEAALLDWDAEKYRQALDRPA